MHEHSRPRMANLAIAIIVLSVAGTGLPALHAAAQEGSQTDATTYTLTGQARDQATGQALANLTLQVENSYDPERADDDEARYIKEPEHGHQSFQATTGPNGTYTIEVHEGWVSLRVEAEGYQTLTRSGHAQSNLTVDLPMRADDQDGATVTGQLLSSEGGPVTDGWVSISPDHRERCDGDVCIMEGQSSATQEAMPVESSDSGFSIHHASRYQAYASTRVAEDGTFELHVSPGDKRLHASAGDHLSEQRELSLASGEEREVTLTLEAIPEDSVRVHGQVLDAEDGEPIQEARVSVGNQAWGVWNGTLTDEDGRFELFTKPGYSLIEVRADREYWVPCEQDRAVSSPSDEEIARSVAPCAQQTREHGYLSFSTSFTAQAGQSVEHQVELERAPSADSRFQGWVINASSQQGVEGARVSFWNEEVGDWGQATTDEDGSYTIDVRAGYYTVRVWADGYYANATNARVASGATETLTVAVEPGQTRYGGCCIAYAESARAGDDGQAAEGVAMDASTGPQGSQTMASEGSGFEEPTGEQAYQGSGGDLGPYPGAQSHDDGQPGAQETPLLGIVASLVLIAMGAVLLAVWGPDRD